MKFLSYVFPFLIVTLLQSSCTHVDHQPTLPFDQASLYIERHPEESSHYFILAPTSIEYIRATYEHEYYMWAGILRGIRSRQDDPEELDKFLTRLERANEEKKQKELEQYLNNFASRLMDGDRLYYFRYRKDGYSDTGVLVIRDGEIVYRERESFAQTSDKTVPEEEDLEFDKL